MTVQATLEKKLQNKFNPLHLEVHNESHKHNVPRGAESHFKVVIVSELFEAKSLVEQHQMVNRVLAEDLAGPLHALSIQAKTPAQWERSGHHVRNTPDCMGGSHAKP